MLQPLHDYVLLKREKEEKTTASGIILTSGKENLNWPLLLQSVQVLKIVNML